jgi:hypothetical protein
MGRRGFSGRLSSRRIFIEAAGLQRYGALRGKIEGLNCSRVTWKFSRTSSSVEVFRFSKIADWHCGYRENPSAADLAGNTLRGGRLADRIGPEL